MSRFKDFLKSMLPNIIIIRIRKIIYLFRSRRLQRNGKDILHDLMSLVNSESDLKLFAVMGTLLGLHRERGIIKGDLDIDVACFCTDLPEVLRKLEKCGVKFKHQFISADNERHTEISFWYRAIKFDLYVFHDEKKGVYCTEYDFHNNAYRQTLLHFPKFTLTNCSIGKLRFCIPTMPELFLKTRYGSGYMTPDSTYDYRNPAACKEISYEIINFIKF